MLMSAVDEVPKNIPSAITSSDYQNASDAEAFFTQLRDDIELNEHLITFEVDNGWFDVDGTNPSRTSHPLTTLASPYATMSPHGMGANGRTTGDVGSFSGTHNPNADGTGTVRFMESGSNFKVDFNLSTIGNFAGVDEPGLAREAITGNNDRGINVTDGIDAVTGDSYDQFLEVLPSESAEGQLEVKFSGNDFTDGSDWENPVYGFGFYLMGRQDKRDVILDIYDINDNLITSHLTHGAGVPSTDAAVEYIAFHICEDEADIGRFVLREPINETTDTGPAGLHNGNRDIFSIDNLTLFTRTENSSGSFELIDEHTIIQDQLIRHHSSEGRDNLIGTDGADAFVLEKPMRFGNQYADRITNYRSEEGDVIELSANLFDGRTKLEISQVNDRRDLKQVSGTDVDIVIWEQKKRPMTMLLVNSNGEAPGFGEGHGLMAVIEGVTDFNAESLVVA